MVSKYGSLSALARASFAELDSIPGVGPAKAAAVRSAFQLARRLSEERLPERPVIEGPEQIADLVREEFRTLDIERFVVILLNARRRLIAISRVADGSLASIVIHPREVFAPAISMRAHAIAIAHNHPSGDPMPSGADIQLTRRLVSAAQLLGIEIVDHVILGHSSEGQPKDFASLRMLGVLGQPGIPCANPVSKNASRKRCLSG